MAKQKSPDEIEKMNVEEINQMINKLGSRLTKVMEISVKEGQKVIKQEGLSKVLDIKFIKDEEKGFSFQIVPKNNGN